MKEASTFYGMVTLLVLFFGGDSTSAAAGCAIIGIISIVIPDKVYRKHAGYPLCRILRKISITLTRD